MVMLEAVVALITILGAVISALKFTQRIFFNDIKKSLARLEFLHLVDHRPEEKERICQAYDAYIELGGNSYAAQVFEEWRAVHENKN